MQIVTVSDGIIIIPHSKLASFVLWQLSVFIGSYEVCTNPDAYPMDRRLKLSI